ncbi:uncharacterized protein PSFLO_06228 [Pseudozyma flocculosa]|uniref:BRCA1-associated protein n=2 Tax=Pseudozyma flocculosa TaxID=84751 RepID=A0A5C3F9H9_9BASI|nr:uncharacterized protein PSFLO_06228 [Pseudozyma flocculosa]
MSQTASSSTGVSQADPALSSDPVGPVTPTTRSKKKRVFHSAKPQITAPVAVFQKQDSFQVNDGQSSKQKDRSNAGSSASEPMDIGSTEVAFGIVHLFKDKQDAAAAPETDAAAEDNQLTDNDVGTVVAVLAVPSYLTAADFLAFVEPASEAICHLRMIRDVHPNRCMVLFKFRDASDAEDFHKMFNGQPFNAMEPEEICQVVYVTSVTVSKQSTLPLTYPMLSNSDPWPLRARSAPGGSIEVASAPSGYELPTCPVCLERMDSAVTGLMTITCQHTFHCSCLSKWGEGRCPVCRYSQTGHRKKGSQRASRRQSLNPAANAGEGAAADLDDEEVEESDEDEVEPSLCTICKTNQDLWVCLICASVGCGRYKAGHAHRHFEETGHLYSLELETQRVWDYAGDGYVHRLIQNKADGKLVELPSASSAAATPERSRRLPASTAMQNPSSSSQGGPRSGADGRGPRRSDDAADESDVFDDGGPSSTVAASEKIEAIGLEYSYLLTSQLESQRHFYEERIDRIQAQFDKLMSTMRQVESAASRLVEVEERARRLEAERDELRREKAKSDKRADKMLELARKFESEMQSERSLSEGLMRKLEKRQEGEASLQAEVDELRDQVKDLMFFLQARDKVEQEGGEDLRGGDLEVKQSAASKKKKGKKKS